jgi:glutathione S-transferase
MPHKHRDFMVRQAPAAPCDGHAWLQPRPAMGTRGSSRALRFYDPRLFDNPTTRNPTLPQRLSRLGFGRATSPRNAISKKLTLISHPICPYVQRAAIVLLEKDRGFERKNIDLENKPDWFLELSPLGKTPILLVDDSPIFESAVICEYLDETVGKPIHPADAFRRAHHRSWVEFASSLLSSIVEFYGAPDEASMKDAVKECRDRFEHLEDALGDTKYFDGEFSMVDAAFAPVFRFFNTFDDIEDFGMLTKLPKIAKWRKVLAERHSVQQAVGADYGDVFKAYIKGHDSALASRIG